MTNRVWLVALLLVLLASQLAVIASRHSQTWDEGDHIYAGYRSVTDGDFGLNPEHPPMVKMLAALPLLSMRLRVPALQNREFKHEAFMGGRRFVFDNDADAVLFRARMAAALVTLLMALLAFAAAKEMFGWGAAFIALVLLAFDPNLLAHGALVTTDMGLSCFLFATVYAFYRYVRAPSAMRLAIVGGAAGLTLAAKHTGILVFPMLILLALTELRTTSDAAPGGIGSRALRLTRALVVVGLIALAVLWAFYGFRYAARPGELSINPSFGEFVKQAPKPYQVWVLSTLARLHVLPESYLYGLSDVLVMEAFYTSYVWGKVFPHGVWFYFPVAFAVKSTLAFLVLPFVVAVVVATGRFRARRETLFLALPPLVHMLVAMSSRMNIGVRHILPLYVFLAVLGGGVLWALAERSRRWRVAVAVLLLVHVASSVRAFPAYIAYSNELWGGPSKTYRYLTDSNSDWGQQLKDLNTYLAGRHVKDCWFAYFAQGTADTSYYGIPCKALPTPDGFWLKEPFDAPAEIDGPVIISAGVLSGFEMGPPPLNPYAQFQTIAPTTLIDGGLFVFDGHFRIALASALALSDRAGGELAAGHLESARDLAQQAVALAPEAVRPNVLLADVLVALGQPDEARPLYATARRAAQTVAPEFQGYWVGIVDSKLRALPAPPLT